MERGEEADAEADASGRERLAPFVKTFSAKPEVTGLGAFSWEQMQKQLAASIFDRVNGRAIRTVQWLRTQVRLGLRKRRR